MSVYGKLVNDTFDILDIEETDTSLVRNPDMIRFTYKHDGKLIQYVKTVDTPVVPLAGSLLVSKHGVLVSTYDRKNNRTVAKLLANISQAHRSKSVTIGHLTKTAHLLPVELI